MIYAQIHYVKLVTERMKNEKKIFVGNEGCFNNRH